MPKTQSRPLAVVVLAAGKGKRLKSKTPKVLHPVCGRPVLWHVLKAAAAAKPDLLAVVVSFDREQVENAVREWGIKPEPVFVDQGRPLGTGHAVMVCENELVGVEDVLVLPGDEPLHTGGDLKNLLKAHRKSNAAGTVIITELPDANGYGRIIRDGNEFVRIAEDRDATPAERGIKEVATCVYAFRRPALFAALPLVGTDNSQGEYYLPDVLGILKEKGEPIGVVKIDDGGGLGTNNRSELAAVSKIMRARINAEHMAAGVTMIDPAETYIDVDVKIGEDTVIYPQTSLYPGTRIGAGCSIGPATAIADSRIGDGSRVEFSVVKGAKIGQGCAVGPYTHIRPGVVLADGARAGAFVELKASTLGEGSKVPHLAYIGDATIGKNVNIGAGTVTVNYDGYDKHATTIGDDARIGSDSMLVAPLKVGKGAVTGAGSTITKDVKPGDLAVERGEQRTVPGYRKRKDAEHKKGKT